MIWTLLLIVPALLLALPGLALLLQVLGARRLARAAAAAPAQPLTWADGPPVEGTVAVLIPAGRSRREVVSETIATMVAEGRR